MKPWLNHLRSPKAGSQPEPAPERAPAAAAPAPVLAKAAGRLPNFFISGAARSGTTSLWQYLRQHPDIFMPPVFELKEPSYFCDRYRYGMKDWEAYLGLFAEAKGQRQVGEASGPYLTSPESPGWIKRIIPDARFIISLRNPAERAYSLYKWMHQYGFELLPSFAEALQAETDSRFDQEEFRNNNCQYYYNFLYFHSGLYYEQVRRFFDTFGRDRVQVVIFEEFTRQPADHMRKLFDFLGVDPSFSPAIEIHNPSSATYGAMDPGLRARLLEQYAPNIGLLEALLNRDLSSLWF